MWFKKNVLSFLLHTDTALQFEHPFYNMLEGENTSVCIVSKEGIQRAVEVNVIPSSQSKEFE